MSEKAEVSLGGGEEFDILLSPQTPRGYWSRLKEEVDEGYAYFWKNDQICGFDKEGKRIGTGIPRELNQFMGNHEYSL